MTVRGHNPVDLGLFKGLWQRDDPDNTPLDHFEFVQNLTPIGNDWETAPGITISQDVTAPIGDIKRIYNYPTLTANTQLILIDDAGTGKIYHLVNSTTIYGPILSKVGMTDFAFVPYAGRAYITPFITVTTGDINIQKGMQSEFLYVYLGAGVAARKAAGVGPTNTALTIANGAAGHTDPGLHIFATVYEYNTGYLSPPSQFTQFSTVAGSSVSFAGIQTTGDTNVTKVHIVATKVITNFNGNLEGYQFFFIPDANVNNGTLVLNNVSFYDDELLEDASHLIDNYTEIPAGCSLSIYRNRLVLTTTYDNINLLLISEAGEPEAINQITGILEFPPDGNPVTCTQELRDVLYVGKRSKVGSYTDNGDDPANWDTTFNLVDSSLGWPVHGIATVLDSGGASVDFLICTTFTGIAIFNGRFILPELSYKIQGLWFELERNQFRKIQIVNAAINKWILCVLPDSRLLIGDYSNGLDPKNIRWTFRSFYTIVNSVAVVNIDQIILGMDNPNPNV